MILEKIKNNAGKISFFFVSVLFVVAAVMYMRQQDLKRALEASKLNNENLVNDGQKKDAGNTATNQAISSSTSSPAIKTKTS